MSVIASKSPIGRVLAIVAGDGGDDVALSMCITNCGCLAGGIVGGCGDCGGGF